MGLRSKWTVRVESLSTTLRVGIYDHELVHQPVLLNLRISGLAEALPSALSQCFDYEPICRWALEEWPLSPHTPLLETRLNELIEYVFTSDKRIRDVFCGLYKTDAFLHTKFVGLERDVTRRQFEEQNRSRLGYYAERDQQEDKPPKPALKPRKKNPLSLQPV
jgi:dihydroneopterin aldolase